ncbi:MAG: response regulator, partial [Bacteroidales bacterium]|nr:response regulator [Bacteroidales bacterium]
LKAELIWAKDGQTAVDYCKDDPTIDLVLMDIQLPKLTGFEATPLIKKVRPNLPVIAQTAYTMSGEEQKCYEAGCDDYMAKPIIPGDLIQKVCKYLNGSKKKENT